MIIYQFSVNPYFEFLKAEPVNSMDCWKGSRLLVEWLSMYKGRLGLPCLYTHEQGAKNVRPELSPKTKVGTVGSIKLNPNAAASLEQARLHHCVLRGPRGGGLTSKLNHKPELHFVLWNSEHICSPFFSFFIPSFKISSCPYLRSC